MLDHDAEPSWSSIDESEIIEEDGTEEGMLSVSEICEVAERRLGMTLGAAGRGSDSPKPASAYSYSCSASISLRMSCAARVDAWTAS